MPEAITRMGSAPASKTRLLAICATVVPIRDDAWMHAEMISLQPPSSWPLTVQTIDDKVKFLGRLIAQPGGIVGAAVGIIRDTESKDVPAIIDALSSIVPAT